LVHNSLIRGTQAGKREEKSRKRGKGLVIRLSNADSFAQIRRGGKRGRKTSTEEGEKTEGKQSPLVSRLHGSASSGPAESALREEGKINTLRAGRDRRPEHVVATE